MEAGNRCFDQRVPEEINRKLVDNLSDINMPYSDIARGYLVTEGFPQDRIIKTGSPMYEIIQYYKDGIDASDILNRLKLSPEDFFVVSAHREENVDSDENLDKLINALNGIAKAYKKRVIVTTHPRTRLRFKNRNAEFHDLVELLDPFGFFDYEKLQKHAKAVLSDSGTICEESSVLNFPALNIREAHERPEGMEEAMVMMVGLELERILQGLDILKDQPRGQDRMLRIAKDYEVPNVSEKVLRIIMSYTDYVNRKVWNK
jgi:UDP-N-acetylglucosamine 2-epimerase